MVTVLNLPALLVAHQNVLKRCGGGVQVCHAEYAASLQAAGFLLRTIPFEFSRGIIGRTLNRILPKVAHPSEPPHLFQEIKTAALETNARFIFFEWSVFPELSEKLNKELPMIRQVLLSHGVESLDFCLEQRLRRERRAENRFRLLGERMLGEQILYEATQRRWLDAVLTVSSLEVEVEKWLGSRNVMWAPRVILEPPLDAQPIDQRVGCVSTLNHIPNAAGLRQLFDALDGNTSSNFRFRLVGQPAECGRAFAQRYSFVEYLGPLTDAQLRLEAATWSCFVHPIFEYAKGYSTKLGMALGWGLPIATSEFGARGYVWDRQLLPLARSTAELVQLVQERCVVHRFCEHRQATKHVADLAPKLEQVGAEISDFLRL
jgi:hypothetical protein